MQIYPAGSRPSRKATSDYFTGTVWQEPIIEAPDPARIRALRVAFEPGARTAWHTHPYGQTLHVTDGVGLVCMRGEAPRVIRTGDTVWIPPDVEHWHGAAPDVAMVHLALQEAKDGTPAYWQEHVTDADYAVKPVAGQLRGICRERTENHVRSKRLARMNAPKSARSPTAY